MKYRTEKESFENMSVIIAFNLHLNGKNLLNNSSWDFEPIFDSRNSYGYCPAPIFFSRSLVYFVNPD